MYVITEASDILFLRFQKAAIQQPVQIVEEQPESLNVMPQIHKYRIQVTIPSKPNSFPVIEEYQKKIVDLQIY